VGHDLYCDGRCNWHAVPSNLAVVAKLKVLSSHAYSVEDAVGTV
jgi:hypothetical protein